MEPLRRRLEHRPSSVAAALLAALALPLAAPAGACGPDSDCVVEGGAYRVRAPAIWDGRSALPAAVFFHGWKASAADVMADEDLGEAFARAGILLVAPDGLGHAWAHHGSPSAAGSRHRDEAAFVDAVVEDVTRRFPLDRAKLWATGFSIGGSMVWDLACGHPERFAAFVAVAGAFWEPMPERCAGPVRLLHLHGLVDETVPLEGRAIRGSFRQGDVFAAMQVLRTTDGCRSNPTRHERRGELVCRAWDGCTVGGALALCLHPAGHELPPGWAETAWAWVQAVTRLEPDR